MQALTIYENLLSSLPHLRPSPADSASSGYTSLQPLIELASDGLDIFTQRGPPPLPADIDHAPTHAPVPGLKRSSAKEKGDTKCLGCGATETPEWRRGPMGPRTLCNACVSLLLAD
jgi:hypothetical protein